MKKKLIGLFLITAVIAAVLSSVFSGTPALADQPPDKVSMPSVIGQETQVDKYTKVKLIKNNYDENGKKESSTYEATISTLPATTDDGQLIDCRWYEKKDPAGYKYYESGNNLFTVLVTPEGRTSIRDSNGRLFVWTPVLSIGAQSLHSDKFKLLSKDPINENYSKNTLQWTYTAEVGGFLGFFTRTVIILRQLRIIEGMLLESYVIDSDPGGDFKVLRSVQSEPGVEGYLTDAVAWDSSERLHYLQVNNQYNGFIILAEEFSDKTYPVIVDPFYTTTADDGQISKGSTSYSTAQGSSTGTIGGGTLGTIGQHSSGSVYGVNRFVVFLDTSAIGAAAVIDSASLKIYGYSDASDRDFYITIQSGMPTYPHIPPVPGDYDCSNYDGNGGSLSTSGFSIWSYNIFDLSPTGESWINQTGYTKFMLRSSRDISGTTPSGWEAVTIYSREYGTSRAPKLEVTFHAPVVPPTVSTVSADNIGETHMTLEGYLDDDGGEPCDVKFEYGYDTDYGLSSVPLVKEAGETFNIGITGLTRGTLVYYRAIATNGIDSSEGDPGKSATTLPAQPNTLVATAGNQQNVLTWVKGDGANKTIVVRKATTGYPSSRSDGDVVYNETGTGFTDTPLTAGITYYYSAWSEKNGQYSTLPDHDNATPFYTGAPDVTTRDTTPVGTTTATVRGYLDAINQVGGTVDCTLQYYYGEGSWADNETDIDELSSYGSFGEAISGLETDTLYYVRAKAVGDNGTGYGDTETFTTDANYAPEITSVAATGTGLTYSTFNGIVTDDGGLDVTVWYVWGLSADNLDSPPTGTGTEFRTGDKFPCPKDDFDPDTQYFFQAVGQNDEGIGYGDILNFTTDAPSAPTVTTDDSDVGANEATIHGTVTYDGGVPCEVRFEWGNSTGAPYDNSTGWQEGFETGESFEALISPLTVGQDYYYRAVVKNITDTVEGDEETFTTVFVAPTNFTAKSTGATTISLAWDKQGDKTYITVNILRYPVDREDGTQVYFGTASSCTDDSLTPGITYFYRAWSWRNGDVWSGTYAEDAATTLPLKTSEEEETPDIQPIPIFPEGMYQDPDENKLANMPGYDMINTAADEMEMDRGMFWLLISMGILLALGLVLYVPTRSVLLAAVVMGAGMAFCAWAGIMPWWIIIIFIILGLGMSRMFSGLGRTS